MPLAANQSPCFSAGFYLHLNAVCSSFAKSQGSVYSQSKRHSLNSQKRKQKMRKFYTHLSEIEGHRLNDLQDSSSKLEHHKHHLVLQLFCSWLISFGARHLLLNTAFSFLDSFVQGNFFYIINSFISSVLMIFPHLYVMVLLHRYEGILFSHF